MMRSIVAVLLLASAGLGCAATPPVPAVAPEDVHLPHEWLSVTAVFNSSLSGSAGPILVVLAFENRGSEQLTISQVEIGECVSPIEYRDSAPMHIEPPPPLQAIASANLAPRGIQSGEMSAIALQIPRFYGTAWEWMWVRAVLGIGDRTTRVQYVVPTPDMFVRPEMRLVLHPAFKPTAE